MLLIRQSLLFGKHALVSVLCDMVVFLISVWEWNSACSLIHVVREFLWIRPSWTGTVPMIEGACPQSHSAMSQSPRPLRPHMSHPDTQNLLQKIVCVVGSCPWQAPGPSVPIDLSRLHSFLRCFSLLCCGLGKGLRT